MLQKLKQWLFQDRLIEKLYKAHVAVQELTKIIEEQNETIVELQKELQFYRSQLYDLPEGAEVSE